jgi:DMSO/TMAO reductase YedYZ molybdopterin-dependent catalytic subunit
MFTMLPSSGPTARRSRRQFLRDAGLAALPFLVGTRLFAEKPGGLIPREKNPDNLEFPFDTLDSFITPTDLFYVRNHFAAPAIRQEDWSLDVVGAVEKPLKLTYRELKALPPTKVPLTLECAGNGRSFLTPKTRGVQWELGAVSTAEWTGVTVAAVLERARVKPGAVEVLLEGADAGEVKDDPKPVGKVAFARSLPLEKATKPEVLLAYGMNGESLPAAHGFPLRAIVGGWYGMASVKWLRRIIVLDRPFTGYWQTTGYTVWDQRADLPVLMPLNDVQVKASIARPRPAEVLSAGKPTRVHGAAWAGEFKVDRVEVTTDGGKTWAAAKLLGEPVPWCWRFWEFQWNAPAAGAHVLMARATDDRGRVQPMSRDENRRNYLINHCVGTEVTVR